MLAQKYGYKNPENIVRLIKLGNLGLLKESLESKEYIVLLEQLNQLQGYVDPEYSKYFRDNIHY